jgi:hypothetical protein
MDTWLSKKTCPKPRFKLRFKTSTVRVQYPSTVLTNKMQFALLFATFNLISAVALPGMMSSLLNKFERFSMGLTQKSFKIGIENPTSPIAAKHLFYGKERSMIWKRYTPVDKPR